jgi:hypothetical protein
MARARSYVATELLDIRRAKIASEGPRPYSGLESKVTWRGRSLASIGCQGEQSARSEATDRRGLGTATVEAWPRGLHGQRAARLSPARTDAAMRTLMRTDAVHERRNCGYLGFVRTAW